MGRMFQKFRSLSKFKATLSTISIISFIDALAHYFTYDLFWFSVGVAVSIAALIMLFLSELASLFN